MPGHPGDVAGRIKAERVAPIGGLAADAALAPESFVGEGVVPVLPAIEMHKDIIAAGNTEQPESAASQRDATTVGAALGEPGLSRGVEGCAHRIGPSARSDATNATNATFVAPIARQTRHPL